MSDDARERAMAYVSVGDVIPESILAELDPGVQEELTRAAKHQAWLMWAPRIGVPPRLTGVGWDDKPTPAIDAVKTFMAKRYHNGGCLVLAGPTGVGKSWAAALALRLAGRGAWRFWYFPALCGAWLDPERRAGAIEASQSAPFAVFDDFGVEYAKEGGLAEAFLDEMIWHREAYYRATVITTNLTAEGLRDRLPPRLVDRLRGTWGRIVECPGESLR